MTEKNYNQLRILYSVEISFRKDGDKQKTKKKIDYYQNFFKRIATGNYLG